MCAKIIKGSTFVIIKLSYTKQSNQLWIVNMSYLLQPVCPSPHSSDTQQSYQHINISSTCHIILYFILFVDVPLNLISKMFFLSFASLSIILNKSDLSRMPLFYLSFHFLFFFFFLSSGCTYYSYFFFFYWVHYIRVDFTAGPGHGHSKSKEHSCISHFMQGWSEVLN